MRLAGWAKAQRLHSEKNSALRFVNDRMILKLKTEPLEAKGAAPTFVPPFNLSAARQQSLGYTRPAHCDYTAICVELCVEFMGGVTYAYKSGTG
jgi:hypothetical protein